MLVFPTLESAVKEGFHWLEYQPDQGLHLVERVFERSDGQLVKALAFARGKAT